MALITGGAGFIGSGVADRLLGRGESVTILDSFVRPGGRDRIARLEARHGRSRLRIVRGDVRDYAVLAEVTQGAGVIYHLAGQVAVTSSVADPRLDFEANALGTLNALEAARHHAPSAIFLYASTNKVYGDLESLGIHEEASRYVFADLPYGVSEAQPLDFHSPYGCSKGAGDQYVRDYHRIYGLRTVVLRQSCVFGPNQSGTEDQGWLMWLMLAAQHGRPITIYGNGKQVRDVLFIDDLLDAYDAAVTSANQASGQVYNIGGGRDRSLSIWREFGRLLERLLVRSIPVRYAAWRPGDQRVYVSDIRKAARELGWSPKVPVEEGVSRMLKWAKGMTPSGLTGPEQSPRPGVTSH
jgi:CDP-paratose 2-epimerase